MVTIYIILKSRFRLSVIVELKNFIISHNNSLLPILAMLFSFTNSWHCSLMCGPMISVTQEKNKNYLFFRLVSYTLMGIITGFLGNILIYSLEFKLLNLISLGVLFTIAVISFFPKVFHIFKKNRWIPSAHINKKYSAALTGSLMALIPCHLLFFYYGLSILIGSPWKGGVLLFIHALMTTPALAFTTKIEKLLLIDKKNRIGFSVRILLYFLVVFNFYIYLSKVFVDSGHKNMSELFCF